MGKKLKVGDVFEFGADSESFGTGQIVEGGDQLFIVIFEPLYNNEQKNNLENLSKAKILLLGHTTDSQLYHKHWKIIANESIDYGNQSQLVKYRKFNYRSSYSANVFDQAFCAYHQIKDWKEHYTELTISKAELEFKN